MSGADGRTDALAAARAYFSAIAAGDRGAQRAWYHPDARLTLQGYFHDVGSDEAIAWFDELYAAFPDLRLEIIHLIGDAERAVVHWRLTGTFTGPGSFHGFVPNGAHLDSRGCDVVTARDGLVGTIDAYTDGMTIARQLGVMPAQGSLLERALVWACNLRTRIMRLLPGRSRS